MDFRNVDDVMSCQVCFEPYQSTGEHVPRILPCNHTLCEKCIGQLIQRSYIVCPECRARHFAGDSKLTFPQNKYILVNIHKTETPTQCDPRGGICKKHRKEKEFHCTDTKCNKAICSSCFLEEHKSHDVVEMEKEEKIVLLRKLHAIKIDLEAKRKNVLDAKQEVQANIETCISDIKTKKDELINSISKRMDVLAYYVIGQKKEVTREFNKDVAILDENIRVLDSIKDNVHKAGTNIDISSSLDMVGDNVVQNLLGSRIYRYHKYKKNVLGNESNDRQCGDIILCEKRVNLPALEIEITRPTGEKK